MGPEGLHHEVAEIRTLLTERLRIKGRSLESQIRKAGRLLPKRIRAEAAYLIKADALIKNPKLARMIDARKVDRAHAQVVEYLHGIDPAQRRKEILLGTLALWSFYAFVILGAALAFVWWRGLI